MRDVAFECPPVSVEHYNERRSIWIERVARTYPACVWLNPLPKASDHAMSSASLRQLLGGGCIPLTLEGLDGMRELVSRWAMLDCPRAFMPLARSTMIIHRTLL
jgi:uncharacterized protein with von Willebrand factor type A (vWA) domain